MTPNSDLQERIRRYLLGKLPAAEQEEIERDLMTNSDRFEELLVIEDELIDDYLSSELTADDRAAFESHFLSTAERHDQLRFGRAFNRYVTSQFAARTTAAKPSPLRRSSPSRIASLWARVPQLFSSPVKIAVAAIIVIGIALGGWRIFFHQSEVDRGLLALNAAYKDQRPLESRISALSYAPFSETRGSPDDQRVDKRARDRAELILNTAASDPRDAAAHHALGQVYLAAKRFDEAITEFDLALKSDPQNAKLYNDLGSAWLEKGKIDLAGKDPGKGMNDLGLSLEDFNKALELNPKLLEALFNRALSRQHQSLYAQAEADWQAYLQRDPNSQWAAEAKKYLKLIQERKAGAPLTQQRPVDRFVTAYHAGADDEAWDIYRHNYTSWGNKVADDLIDGLNGKSNEDYLAGVSAINYLGQLQLRKTGDANGVDIAAAYDSAGTESRSALFEARNKITAGQKLLAQSKIAESFVCFSDARQEFAAAGDEAEALLAEYALAVGATLQPDLEKSGQILGRIIPICETKSYKWLLSLCLSERAHLQANLNNFSAGIDDAQRSLEISQELRDPTGTSGALFQLASLHLFLNDNERSLGLLRQALDLVESEQIPRAQSWGMLVAVSLNLVNLRLYRAALDYQTEALDLAIETKRPPLVVSRSYGYRGLVYGNLGLYDAAIQDLREAYRQGESLASEKTGQNMMANASLKLGDIYRSFGDQVKARTAYDDSIRLYDTLTFGHYSYAAHKGKFLSYRAENDDVNAAQELSVVLKLFDEYREKILEERQSSFFFDKEQDIYDLAIDFAYSRRKDPQLAFQYSEESRARTLLDLLRNGGAVVEKQAPELRRSGEITQSLTAAQVQETMPANVQLLQYAVLKNQIIVWSITKSAVVAQSSNIDASSLATEISASLEAITRGDSAGTARHLSTLYALLIEPIENSLDRDKIVCIVPDKDLNYVPFAALLSSKSNRYVIQDYRLLLAPSASVFIHCTNVARSKAGPRDEKLLAVGNPRFDRELYSQYPDLPAAEREARGISQFYRAPRVLIGEQATVRAAKHELLGSDVAHFASHYVIDPQSSLSSKLLLAKPDENEPGELASRDICRMKLARTRLVVLSACQTGIERQFRGEGPTSFARQFMIAGVPEVVASLWAADADATEPLMVAFHRHRELEHLPAVEALRLAQLEMLTNDDPRYARPYYWAPFVIIGGYAQF